MTEIVPEEDIERLVGVRRQSVHFARAVTADQKVYILHSIGCKAHTPDLRMCAFSIALDYGLDEKYWKDLYDAPVWVTVLNGKLVPVESYSDF